MKYYLFANIKYYNIQAIHTNNVSLHYLLYWQQAAYHLFGYPFTIALFLNLTVILQGYTFYLDNGKGGYRPIP